jgi:hypothetical protein
MTARIIDKDCPFPRLIIGVDGDDAVLVEVFEGLMNFHCEGKSWRGALPIASLKEPVKAAAKVVELLQEQIAEMRDVLR